MEKVKKIPENWDFHRNLSMDILKSLSNEQLGLTVGKNMGTMGEQFRHMAKVQVQYIEAIKNKKVGPVQEKYTEDIEQSKEKLITYLEKVNEEMKNLVENMSDEELGSLKIDWSYWNVNQMNIRDHLVALIDHQNLHNGQLVVYLKTHNIPFPKSWVAWGL